ncbi:type IV toxin-antitoxin system AbiEi family antitoxin domain-containing protein [Nocardioides sp. SYSU DS0651]|uniref:type IV toxin-antitoxin system AbiEi family antitoxin domain-containing protein n=1 Tax=Nocardioides sp. SYSU DS0651 TaxID=3415955 RepID=UPI003F4C9327
MSANDLPEQPFTTADAQSWGLTRKQIERALDSGQIVRCARGVYAPAALTGTPADRARAIRPGLAPHHVVTDRTAAWIHGADAFGWAEHDISVPVETCALRGHNPTRRAEADGRTRDLAATDVVVIDGLRVTTPLRTALDLGCHLRRREALAAMIDLARLHGFGVAELRRELPRFRGRRGVVQLRQLVPLVDARIESAREAWTWLAIHDAGLPMPEPQVWVEIDGEPAFRLDFAYRHARVGVEYDGFDAHDRTPGQREYDERRRAWLREEGWVVIVVRRGDFTGAALDRWLGELREALRPSYSTRRW